MVPFFPSAELLRTVAGLEEGEEPSGGKVLRLIQIRLMCAFLRKPERRCLVR